MNRRSPATVLLLDERGDYRAAFAEALRLAGLNVSECVDSPAALEAINTARPRVIVASFDPRTRDDRLTFCRAIKANSGTKRIPVLLTTTDRVAEDVGLATDPGVMVLTLMQDEGAKLVAAVDGVLTAQRVEPLRASLHRRKNLNRSA
jgi:PleD family two-component response regulator